MSEKKTNPAKGKTLRNQNITRLILLLLILVTLNILASFVFTRFDLTSDKRFTLSPSTKNLAASIEDVIYVRVYLEGDFPPAFKRLQSATREMLDELRIYSNGNLEYEFIDPSENPDQGERNKLYQQLVNQGIQPTSLQAKKKGETSQQVIFPGAIISYHGQELSLMLLQDQIGTSPEQMINNSIQSLEYGFANSLRKLNTRIPQKVAFLEGHGEIDEEHLLDITRNLKSFYDVSRIRMDEKLESLKGIRTLIIPGPDSTFSEKDKFIIDQFIMKGGRVLWLVDGAKVSMDSLQNNEETIALANDINLGDILFRYGARINFDLVLDMQGAPIPIVTGYVGQRPQYTPMPWYYFPIVIPESKHPLVNNLNAIKFDFVSSIDMVGSEKISKTALLNSSQFSRVFVTPARVNLSVMREKPDQKQFNMPYQLVAVLMEGNFDSNFKNRIPPNIATDPQIGFRDKSDSTKMIVISDGDIIKNGYRKSTQTVIPLGQDPYYGQVYGNKNFLLNCIDYLCDDSGLITVRSKEIKLRLLDAARVEEQRLSWQLFNTAGPVLLVVIAGIIKYYRRRSKYAA
jgi:ABC-2 type transport system permease protein